MKDLKNIFNSEAFWDRVSGAVMGAAAGFALLDGQGRGAIAGGFIGLIVGQERITHAFNAAVKGRDMAQAAMLPALRP